MLAYNDMPREDDEAGQLTIDQLNIAFNWQFAIATAEKQKLIDFLNSLDCPDIDIYLDNCQ